MIVPNAKNAWRTRGYDDAKAGKTQRAPLRDDGGEAFDSYLAGYQNGLRERGKRVSQPRP